MSGSPVMRARTVPFWISVVLHIAVFGLATLALVRPPEFAVDAGRSSVEVNLVAAAPDPEPVPPQPDVVEPPPPPDPQPDDVLVPKPPPTPPPPTPAKPKPKVKPTVAKGDGSAPKPGKDATTLSSQGGAIVDAKPDYLRNPPPEYPASAQRNGQQGTTLIEVIVSTEGTPEQVSIQTSSGYASLDNAAVTAVRKWRFRPGEMAGIKVRLHVVCPVVFQLDK